MSFQACDWEKNLWTKKDVKYVTALHGWKPSQNPSLNDSSQKCCCLCSTNPVLDHSQAFGLSRSALEPGTERLQCCSWHGGSCAFCVDAWHCVSKANVSSKTGVWPLKDLHHGIDQICQASFPLHPYFAFASMQRIITQTKAQCLETQILRTQ